ncbi:MAG: ATP-dependent helicase, partial [Longispora sp.]|nr:ATP-dependent helicase [Longispora sp. (in: high G+C Gram-positive bacteria)]
MSFSFSVSAVFLPQLLPRAGRIALWGEGITGPDGVELVVSAGGGVRRRVVKAKLLAVDEALPILLDTSVKSPSLAAWSAVALGGLGILARGRLLPAATEDGYGIWRIGPLEPADAQLLHDLAAAMPPEGHAVPVVGSRPVRVSQPTELIRDFWDALADTLPRGGAKGAFARRSPTKVRGPLDWLQPDDTSKLVLRVTLPEIAGEPYRVAICLRSAVDPSLLIEAGELWTAPQAVTARFGANPETALLTGLRRAARTWSALGSVLGQAILRPIEVDDHGIVELLDVAEKLASAGTEVLLPTELLGEPLRLKAVATPTPGSVAGPAFGLPQLLDFTWQPTLGSERLTADEFAQLAEAKRPLVQLRGRWVRVDPALLRKLRRKHKPLTGLTALAAALTDSLEVDGEQVEFEATGVLLALKHRLAELPEVPIPATLEATLRPYQRRGLNWLAGMTDIGLGGCLADDMGLGKTIQVIALHLHRNRETSDGGPTLVVCPTSLLGNWEREITRFAPGVPVRRYHGGGRHLDEVAADEIVLVTYGIVRNDSAELAGVNWGLVVADEAQYVKNPLSRTARQLRTVPAAARLALSGTPVENRLSELWALLDWTTPGLLGPLSAFQRNVAV